MNRRAHCRYELHNITVQVTVHYINISNISNKTIGKLDDR